MDGKVWQTSTEAQERKGPQCEREEGEDGGVCVCVLGGGINGGMVGGSSKPIRKLAVQLQRNKGTFIIQLGTCQGSQRKKTSNLVLQGEDAQKSGLRVTGTNKRRTKLITRVHCTETQGEGSFKAGTSCPVI